MEGVGVDVWLGVGVFVGVCVGVWLGVGVLVAVGVGVLVGVGVPEGVSDGVGELESVGVVEGVGVEVGVGELLGVVVEVGVGDPVREAVGELLGVPEGVGVPDGVMEGVGVGLGVEEGSIAISTGAGAARTASSTETLRPEQLERRADVAFRRLMSVVVLEETVLFCSPRILSIVSSVQTDGSDVPWQSKETVTVVVTVSTMPRTCCSAEQF